MTNEEIKTERDQNYAQIKSADERLKELRIICKHEKTSECNYSWRPGNIQRADVCDYCGEFIRYVDENNRVNINREKKFKKILNEKDEK